MASLAFSATKSTTEPHPWLFLRATLIAAAATWVFLPCLQGGWIGDDHLYLPQNPLLHDPHRLWKAWFQPGSFIEYYPIQQSLQWLQWQLWGDHTLGYHVTNLVLHIVTALLIWRFFAKLGLAMAWVGGLIFAVHPMTVDSVALVNEFKTVLSLPPFLLAMCSWIDYEDRKQSRDYWLALGLFTVAMLCKIIMTTFPVALLLFAWWKRGHIGWTDVKASAPFFVVAGILALITIWAGNAYREQNQLLADIVPLGGLLPRLALAGSLLLFFSARCVLPIFPQPIYPQWPIEPLTFSLFLPWLVPLIAACWFWKKRHSWGRHALLGLGFFTIMLAPFLGFLAISYMKFTWLWEHLLYLPLLGPLGLVVAALGDLHDKLSFPFRLGGQVILVGLIMALAWQSHLYATAFVDETAIYTYNVRYNPNSPVVRNNLGFALQGIGRQAEAETQYRMALLLDPDYGDAHSNLGVILLNKGETAQAINHLTRALHTDLRDAATHYNLGNAYMQNDQLPEAIDHYREALHYRPAMAEAHYSLGNALVQSGHLPEAIAEYKEALRLKPDYADAHANLGNALLQANQIREAMEQYAAAIALTPSDISSRKTLGLILMQTGQIPQAREQFQAILQIAPHDVEALQNLARIKAAAKSDLPGH